LFGPESDKIDVYVVESDDWQSRVKLTHSPSSYGDLLWSPTDEYLASVTGEGFQHQLIAISLADRELIGLATIPGGGDYTWAPSGNSIAFVQGKYPANNVYTVSVPGGEIKQLTSEAATWYDDLTWLPDGDHIAYTTYHPMGGAHQDGSKEVRVLSLGTLSETTIPEIVLTRQDVYWSPNGRYICYTSGQLGNQNLHIWDRDTERLRVSSSIGWVISLKWSPDSKFLLVNRLDDWNRDGHTEPKLWLLEIDTGRLIPLSGWFPWYRQEVTVDYVEYDDAN
jgi:Tol biopolymer transport system component